MSVGDHLQQAIHDVLVSSSLRTYLKARSDTIANTACIRARWRLEKGRSAGALHKAIMSKDALLRTINNNKY